MQELVEGKRSDVKDWRSFYAGGSVDRTVGWVDPRPEFVAEESWTTFARVDTKVRRQMRPFEVTAPVIEWTPGEK